MTSLLLSQHLRSNHVSPDETLHPQPPLFVWIHEPLECIGFLPPGISTLETWSYLHRPASPTPPTLSLSLFICLSIQQNSTGGLLDLHCIIAHLTRAPIFDLRLAMEGQFEVLGLLSFPAVTG